MPRFAPLLQLLLALVLLLNGVGNAVAGASMQVTTLGGDANAVMQAPEMETAHAGCATRPTAPPPVQDDSCCGGSGYCDFACAQIPALVPPPHGLVVMHHGGMGSERPPRGHEAPALAGVTRPPIA